MKIFFLILILISIELFPIDREKFDQVINLICDRKFDDAKNIIDSLSLSYSNDPEYYVLVLNYYTQKAKKSYISLQTETPNDTMYFEIKDSLDQVVGYLGENSTYDLDFAKEGIALFKPALIKFPNRLDLFFGLVYLTRECKLNSELQSAMEMILNTSKSIDNQWIWSFNEKLSEDPESFMLNNLQAYLNGLLQDESEFSDSIIFAVSEKLVNLYPNCIFGYNNLGVLSYFKSNYEKAIEYFLFAEKINPEDILVLSNIAQNYKLQKNYNLSEKYYRKIIHLGNDDEKLWAEEQINLLKQ